jgi:hypothetical protein
LVQDLHAFYFYNQAFNPHLPVLGVGTVEIPTKRSPNRSGVSSHGSLHLKHVLHVPDFIFNVIGGSIGTFEGYDVELAAVQREWEL